MKTLQSTLKQAEVTVPSPGILLRSSLLLLAVLAGSTAVIMIKASTEHPLLVASYRLLIAAVALSPFFLRDLKSQRALAKQGGPALVSGVYSWRQAAWAAGPALGLAIHFSSWVVGARLTQTSNASLLVNMVPLALPFFLWFFYREKITRSEVIGTFFALGGVVLLSSANFKLSFQTFLGDMICLGSMLAFSCYIALGRKNGARISLFLYVVPLYTMAGLYLLLAALPFVNPIKAYTLQNVLLILGLGIVPTVVGHSLLNYSLQYFRGQVVGIANLGQVVFATLMAAVIFHEIPKPIDYLAAVLIITGILIGILGSRDLVKSPKT
jgi:drug/metabolite transporter (DMT)-like permease